MSQTPPPSAEALNGLLGPYGNLIALAALLVSVVAIVLPYLHSRKDAEKIEDRGTWAALADDLAAKAPRLRYDGALARVSGFFDRVYGAKLVSWRAANRFLLIALLYPIFSALLGWTFFDASSLGGLQLAEDGIPWPLRWGLTLLLCASLFGTFWFIKNETKFTAFADRKFTPLIDKLDHRTGFLPKLILWSLRLTPYVAIAVALAFAITGAGAFTIAVAVALAVTFAFALTIPNAGAFTIAVAFNFAGAGALAIFVAIFDQDYTLLLFFVLLPLCNALTDALSITATRYFLRNLQNSPSAGKIALELAADLIIALISLIVLVCLMTTALDFWGARWPDTLPFDWRDYRTDILSGNWQAGTMLWLMTLTTLLPTLAHVIAGAMALINAHRAERVAAGARLDALCREIPLGTPYEDIPADLRRGDLAAIKKTAAKPNFAGGLVAFVLAALVLALSYAILWGLEELIWGSWAAFPKP